MNSGNWDSGSRARADPVNCSVKACVGCSEADPALPEPHNSPGAGGLRQAWEASAINPAQVLPSCLRAWRHLNAWDGFSTNTFSLKRIFPTFFKKKKKKSTTETDDCLETDRLSVYSEKKNQQ